MLTYSGVGKIGVEVDGDRNRIRSTNQRKQCAHGAAASYVKAELNEID